MRYKRNKKTTDHDRTSQTETLAAWRSRWQRFPHHIANIQSNAALLDKEETDLAVMEEMAGMSAQIGVPMLGKDSYALWRYKVKAYAQEQ